MAAAAAGASFRENVISPPLYHEAETNEEYEEILRELGVDIKNTGIEGSYGRVSPLQLDPDRVAKRLSPRQDPLEQNKRMLMATREALCQISLQGLPCVPSISDVVICKTGRVTLIMENGGEDIFNLYIAKSKVPPLPLLQIYVKRWLQVLSDIHDAGVLHRDVKPENFTLGFLLDYGFSIKIGAGKAKGAMGTAQYLSPEMVLKNKYGFLHDSFSFGAMLFCLFQLQNLIPAVYQSPDSAAAQDDEILYQEHLSNVELQNQIDHLTLMQDAFGKLPQKLLEGRDDICTFDESEGKWILKPCREIPRYRQLFQERMLSNERCKRYDENSVRLLIDLIEKLTDPDTDKRISCKEALNHPFLDALIIRVREKETGIGEKPSIVHLDYIVQEALKRREEQYNEGGDGNDNNYLVQLDGFDLGRAALQDPEAERGPVVYTSTFRRRRRQKD